MKDIGLTAMQSAAREGFELGETIEKITVRIAGKASYIVKLLNVACANSESEYRCTYTFQKIRSGPWVAAIAEAVGDEEHRFLRALPCFFENPLTRKIY